MPKTTAKAAKAKAKRGRKDKTPDEMRDAIIDAMLAHVPFDGWTDAAIRKAGADLGLTSGYISLAFPGGPADMVDFYLQHIDEEMLKKLKRRKLNNMGITRRIRTAIEVRIKINTTHKEAVLRTVTFLALPLNAGLSARSLWRTADAMWRAAGDTATDYNHYTKRMILSGVYASTLLVWLQDDTDDASETFDFLDRRLANVGQFEKFKAEARAEVKKVREKLPDVWRFLGKLRYPEARR